MWWDIFKTAIAAVIIVAEVSHRLPRLGAFLLTLPIAFLRLMSDERPIRPPFAQMISPSRPHAI